MYLAEGLQQKWAPVLNHPDMPEIKDPYRKAVTAVLLENQEKAMAEQASAEGRGSLMEATTSLTSLAPTASSYWWSTISRSSFDLHDSSRNA